MEELENLLTWDQPFGPNASEYIGDEVFGKILDDTNSSFASLRTRPFLIIGRRGSGKTSILKAIKNSKRFNIVAEIPTDASFQEIIDKIDLKTSSSQLAESIFRVWEKVLWTFLFSEINKKYKSKYPIEYSITDSYLESIGIRSGNLPKQILELIVRVLKGKSDAADNALEVLNAMLDSNNTFEQVKVNNIKILKNEKARAVILIDNVEQIDLSDKPSSLAISGLLIAVDSFKNSSIPVDVRCCIPAEIYPRLVRISANSDKSFSSKVVLHWTSSELIHLAALRYKTFLKIHAPRHIYQKVEYLDLSKKSELNNFINLFFPPTITNGLNVKESTMRYILRHTQLLPRQFISYMNQIANFSFERQEGSFVFDEQSVVDAIQEAEHLTCSGVFNGYKKVFPKSEKVCETILPELGLTFEFGEFETIFRRMQKDLPFFDTPNECMKLLVEIGAIGVFERVYEKYLRAQFSYNLPMDLATKHNDLLCVHPAFSGKYRCRINESDYAPIFPKGSEVEPKL